MAATPVTHVATKAIPAYGHGHGGHGGHGGDDNQCGNGILPILNLCN
nr:hypothetical protein [Streptomyces sp. FXJ1.172]WEO94240.1 hypothetical protein A6P39_009555 [Streptomyces sp. FXJ1.172]